MPTATVTIRELKNKDTGLDLNIPSYKEIPGLLGTTIEYHVVAVSRFQCFKSTTHKDTDTVQLMVPKVMDDFEDLKKKLNNKYPGTIFPKLPGKGFTVLGDSHANERRIALEKFLTFVASTAKLAHCQATLEFLGVNPITASKFASSEGVVGAAKASSPVTDIFEDARGKVLSPQEDLFGGGDEDDLDLFQTFSIKSQKEAAAATEGRLFDATVTPSPSGIKLFADPDLGGAVSRVEAEDALFLVPDAVPKATEKDAEKEDEEDNSDLLNIEDDLDKLLQVKPQKEDRPNTLDVVNKASPKAEKPSVPDKPVLKPKPKPEKPKIPAKPGQKPSLAPKPAQKPTIPAKPKLIEDDEEDIFKSSNINNLETPTEEDDLFNPLKKNTNIIESPSDDLFAMAAENSKPADELGTDDIFKYIKDNVDGNTDELDLFS